MNSQQQNQSQVKPPSAIQLQQKAWFEELLVSDNVDSSSHIAGLDQLRDEAGLLIRTLPVLNRKLEAWRYNRVENVFKKNFDPQIDNDFDVNELNIKDYLLPSLESYHLVLINGRCVPELSDLNQLPDGVTLSSLRSAIGTRPEALLDYFDRINQHSILQGNEELFNELNNALFKDGVYLHIDESVELDRPVEITYLNSNQARSAEYDGSMIQSRNIIVLEQSAMATLIEHYVSSQSPDEHYFHNNLTEIVVGDNAELKHYRLQDESREAHHLSNVYITQQKQSHYYNVSLAFGGAWSKTHYNVNFNAPQAECDLQGLYAVGDQQLMDFHLDVKHQVASCRSRENYKGIVYGRGRAVFDGRILVEKQAQHSDASLTNDNLLLVHDAEVNTKPQLEIYADDVKCSHGTTVGRLDPQQLFYLRCRGIAEDDARKMLCHGFASDIIDSIEHSGVRDFVASKLLHALNRSQAQITDLNGQENGREIGLDNGH